MASKNREKEIESIDERSSSSSISSSALNSSLRSAFSLIETLLFFGIFGIMSMTIVGVLIATQDARLRQQGIASLEQQGALLMQQVTRRIRRSESILWPVASRSGSVLALQSGLNSEYPTIFTASGGNILMVEKTTLSSVLPPSVRLDTINFRHVATGSLVLSFDLSTIIAIPRAPVYRRHFESAVTLFPDDLQEAGGCGSCPAPTCSAHKFHWHYCSSDVCTPSGTGTYLAC